MAAAPDDRARLEAETMMRVYQPALSQSLAAIPDGVHIRHDGFAHIGNCDTYYLITLNAVYYCEQEKAGLFRKQYVPKRYDIGDNDSLDVETNRFGTYVRFMGTQGMQLCIWFRDELSDLRGMSAEGEAMKFATDFGT